MDPQVLTDTLPLILEIVESQTEPGKLVARGTFARGDQPTANNRFYPGKVWLREISRLKPKMEGRSLFGMLDHPKDGKTSLEKASHLIRNLQFDGRTVVGELEVLDTPTGRVAKTIIESGAKIGVSSRGLGTTKKDPQGRDVVQDDYKLLTFDLVADPAASTAWPEFATEGTNFPEADMPVPKTVEELKVQSPDLIKQIEEAAAAKSANLGSSSGMSQQEMEKKLLDMIAAERSGLEDQIRGELMSDPEIGGAKLAMESVIKTLRPLLLPEDAETVVSNRDEMIRSLQARIVELEEGAKTQQGTMEEMMLQLEGTSRMFFMERKLNENATSEEKERVIALLGDVGRFPNHDEFKEAMASACERVRDDGQRQTNESERIAELEKKLAEKDDQLKKSLRLGNALGARAYAERRISKHPHAPALREHIEQLGAITQQHVDAIIESWDSKHDVSPEFDRINTSLQGGLDHVPNDENLVTEGSEGNGSGYHTEDMELMGVSIKELQERAGIQTTDPEDNRPY